MASVSKKKLPPRQAVNQSVLYSVQSKAKLAEILKISPEKLKSLCSVGRHYLVFDIEQQGGKKRTVETPGFHLRPIHDNIFSILSRISTPDYLHSGVKGRSYITNAEAHIGKGYLLKLDITRFFPSTTRAHAKKLFLNHFHCSVDVASSIANLCSIDERGFSGVTNGHLPTGSPISQSIAFWAHKNLFDALNELAIRNGLIFTCYVDDINFSGEFIDEAFKKEVCRLIRKSDLVPNQKKTQLYRPNQKKLVTGVVVTNDGLLVRNKHREKIWNLYEQLKNSPKGIDSEEYEKNVLKLMGTVNSSMQIDPALSKMKKKVQRLQLPSAPTR